MHFNPEKREFDVRNPFPRTEESTLPALGETPYPMACSHRAKGQGACEHADMMLARMLTRQLAGIVQGSPSLYR